MIGGFCRDRKMPDFQGYSVLQAPGVAPLLSPHCSTLDLPRQDLERMKLIARTQASRKPRKCEVSQVSQVGGGGPWEVVAFRPIGSRPLRGSPNVRHAYMCYPLSSNGSGLGAKPQKESCFPTPFSQLPCCFLKGFCGECQSSFLLWGVMLEGNRDC